MPYQADPAWVLPISPLYSMSLIPYFAIALGHLLSKRARLPI